MYKTLKNKIIQQKAGNNKILKGDIVYGNIR